MTRPRTEGEIGNLCSGDSRHVQSNISGGNTEVQVKVVLHDGQGSSLKAVSWREKGSGVAARANFLIWNGVEAQWGFLGPHSGAKLSRAVHENRAWKSAHTKAFRLGLHLRPADRHERNVIHGVLLGPVLSLLGPVERIWRWTNTTKKNVLVPAARRISVTASFFRMCGIKAPPRAARALANSSHHNIGSCNSSLHAAPLASVHSSPCRWLQRSSPSNVLPHRAISISH